MLVGYGSRKVPDLGVAANAELIRRGLSLVTVAAALAPTQIRAVYSFRPTAAYRLE